MVCVVIIKAVKDLDNEIPSDGLSDRITPGSLVSGREAPSYDEIMQLNFGAYVQVHFPSRMSNTNEKKTTNNDNERLRMTTIGDERVRMNTDEYE